jgi:hypothetical protein
MAAAVSLAIRADERAETTVRALTSVRLAVAPPARKKRRRTRPTTTTSSPATRAGTRAGGSSQATGAELAGPPSGSGVVTS